MGRSRSSVPLRRGETDKRRRLYSHVGFLSLTPLKIEKIREVHLDRDQIDIEGTAVIFESGLTRLSLPISARPSLWLCWMLRALPLRPSDWLVPATLCSSGCGRQVGFDMYCRRLTEGRAHRQSHRRITRAGVTGKGRSAGCCGCCPGM